MDQYRRTYIEGGANFFTVVAYDRRPILTADGVQPLLHSVWMDGRTRFPFTTLAVWQRRF